MKQRLVKIGKAAAILGSTPGMLRKWEASGELLPARKTAGGTRYYDMVDLTRPGKQDAPTVGYARVPSSDRLEELEQQVELLEGYCAARGWRHEVIRDLGSGMNYRKKGLKSLLDRIIDRQMRRLVLTHKDRLLRFSAELVFALCEARGIEVVIINAGKEPSFEEELARDLRDLIEIYSARLYGGRTRKHKRALEALKVLSNVETR